MSDQHQKNRWTWDRVVLTAIGVLVLYALSSGPYVWLLHRPETSFIFEPVWKVFFVIYLPLGWVADNVEPVGYFFDWYLDLWQS